MSEGGHLPAGDAETSPVAAPATFKGWPGPTLLLLGGLLALHLFPLPRPQAQWITDVLQLCLALAAAALCGLAAARERGLGRAFWWFLALGTLVWSAGQAIWTLEAVALHPNVTLSLSDLLFLAYTTPLMIAFLVRPDRPRSSSAGLAFDASLLLVVLLHADAYFALGELVSGNPEGFQWWQVMLLNARGAVLLILFLSLIHGARPPWGRLYRQLGLAFVVLQGGGVAANLFFVSGAYRPGLLDVGWTVPFLWIGLAAAGWKPAPGVPEAGSAVAVPQWRDTRRGTVLALLAVVLVPVLFFVSNFLGPPSPAVQRLRGGITLATTLILGGLFLFRQLNILRRVEQTQLEREESLRLLFTANPHPMWVHDRETTQFLEVNETAVRRYGYTHAEFLALKVSDLLGPGPGRHRLKDGRTIDVEIASHDLEFAGRQAALVVATDVTERNQAEANLRRSEERFQKAFRSSPAAMSITTFREARIVDVNDRFSQMTGYARDELIGRTFRELGLWVPGQAHVPEAGQAGSLQDGEFEYRRKSGEIREARTSYELVEVGGEPCLLGLSEDVSDRRRLEAQLRQVQKMEAVGRLAGGIAHDFNNLLTAIMGYTGLMLRRLGAEDPLRNNAEETLKAAERAAELTRQLLAFSRQQVLIPQVLDLGKVVAETESMLRRLIGEDIELATLASPTLGAVKADRGQVDQAIVNLVVNARDAMPQGGRLAIELTNVELGDAFALEHRGARPGPYVRLAVTDNGVGMSEETQSHLFEPFFTTKEVGKGTGLGLATVYGIVKQSGGYIAVRSELGRGSTFELYLPRVEAIPELRPVERTPTPPGGAETILLVEDDTAVRNLIREILGAAGYRVLAAPDGAAALRQSQEYDGPIHLMITDVVMPGMSGPKLAERMADARPGMRILYVSGYMDDALGQHGVLEPGLSFLPKPLSPDVLAGRVRELLDELPSGHAVPEPAGPKAEAG